MQKLADENSLREFKVKVEELLGSKSDVTHGHSAFNGVTVLLSDTAPTDDDPGVVTLLVSSSALPAITEQTTEDIEKRLNLILFSEIVQGTLTARVFVDGAEDASALVQFGNQSTSNYTVHRDWSNDKVCRGRLSSINTIKVRVSGVEKTFSYTMGTTGAEYEPAMSSGFYVGGTKTRPNCNDENITFRFVYREGTTGSDFQSFRFYHITEFSGGSIDFNRPVDSFLETLTLSSENIGTITIGDSYAEAQIKSLTPSDTYFDLLVEATGADGLKYYLYGATNVDVASVTITNVDVSFFDDTGQGTGRLLFTVETAEPVQENYTVYVSTTNSSQSLIEPSAGTIYAGDSESMNCNAWYPNALATGTHHVEVFLTNSDGDSVSNVYEFDLTH